MSHKYFLPFCLLPLHLIDIFFFRVEVSALIVLLVFAKKSFPMASVLQFSLSNYKVSGHRFRGSIVLKLIFV